MDRVWLHSGKGKPLKEGSLPEEIQRQWILHFLQYTAVEMDQIVGLRPLLQT